MEEKRPRREGFSIGESERGEKKVERRGGKKFYCLRKEMTGWI